MMVPKKISVSVYLTDGAWVTKYFIFKIVYKITPMLINRRTFTWSGYFS